jgi:hypothetical protein
MDRQTRAARKVSPLYWSVGAAYVIGVTAIASAGFIADSTPTILLAGLLSLPASVITLPGYYVAYGLLALVPGANPSVSTSSARSCTADGVCTSTTTGELATWFLVTTTVLGVLAFTVAALLNMLALRFLTARRGSPRKV